MFLVFLLYYICISYLEDMYQSAQEPVRFLRAVKSVAVSLYNFDI